MGDDQIITNGESPKYIQLREILRSRIEDGEFMPGLAIPSESELVDTYGLNRLTVRSAISTLVNEGLLKPVQGKGVFVIGKKLQHNLEKLSGFRQKMREQGAIPDTRTLFKTRRQAGIKYAKIFSIAPEADIYYFRRLYYVNNEPVSLDEIYVPIVYLAGLENMDLDVFSLFDIFEFNNIKIQDAWQTLSTTSLDAKDSRTLKINPNSVVLLFEAISRDDQGRVIEFNRSYTRSDKASFIVHYQRYPQFVNKANGNEINLISGYSR